MVGIVARQIIWRGCCVGPGGEFELGEVILGSGGGENPKCVGWWDVHRRGDM